jgi:long-subunit fatty acid transport protein
VTLGLGAFSPFAERVSWTATSDGQQPARFHAVEMDLRNVALVPALAIRLGAGVRLGAAPGFLFSVGRLVFDEDTALAGGAPGLAADCGGAPCGAENAAAAARYQVSSGLSPFESSLSFTVAGGVHVQRERWAAGAAYITRPLGTNGGVEIGARKTSIEPTSRVQGQPALCPAETTSACLFGHVQYRLPDTIMGGFTYHVTPRLDLGLVLRWLNFSQHQDIRIRVVGPASGGLRAGGLPEQIVLFRGFRDTLDARVRAVVKLGDRVLLSGTLRGETSAVPTAAVTPAAVDGFKIEPAVAAQVRLASWLVVAAGYALTLMPAVDVTASAFDPTAEVACQDAGGDLDVDACQRRRAGRSRPTAAGRYTLMTHGFSLSLAARL